MDPEQLLRAMFEQVSPCLDERQRRLLAAAAARALGRGGITLVARATRMSRQTVYDGLADLDDPTGVAARAGAAAGWGRKRLVEHDPGLVTALEALVDPVTRGDPCSPLRWTCKSTAQLARALTAAVKGAQMRSCSSSVVFVEEPVEQVTSTHGALVILAETDQPGGWIWRLQQQRPVRTVAVVILDVDPKDLLQVVAANDQQPVQALGADRPYPAFRGRVRPGRLERGHRHLATL